jgi:hypothetical protein
MYVVGVAPYVEGQQATGPRQHRNLGLRKILVFALVAAAESRTHEVRICTDGGRKGFIRLSRRQPVYSFRINAMSQAARNKDGLTDFEVQNQRAIVWKQRRSDPVRVLLLHQTSSAMSVADARLSHWSPLWRRVPL